MKLNKLKFKRVKYGFVLSMGAYSHVVNMPDCVESGNYGYNGSNVSCW